MPGKFNLKNVANVVLSVAISLAIPTFSHAQKKTSTPAPAAKSSSSSSTSRSSSSSSSRSNSSSRSTSRSSAPARSSSRSSSASRSSSRSSSTRSSSRSSSHNNNSVLAAQRRQQAAAQKQQRQQAKQQQEQQKQARQRQQQQAKEQAKQQKAQQKQQQQQAKEQEKQRQLQQKQQQQQAREQQKQQKLQAKNQSKQPGAQPQTQASASMAAGAHTFTTPAGHQLNYNASGKLSSVTTHSGAVANFNAQGHVSTIKTANGTVIAHGPAGARTITSERIGPNGSRYQVVSTGAHAGYVQTNFVRGGHQFVSRTYVTGGRTYVAVYQTRFYGGVPYYGYVPGFYFGYGFYGWAYDPWYAPAYYSWGWYGDPWFGDSAYYFAPYSVYPSAAFWLTDYVVSESLRAAFEAREARAMADEQFSGEMYSEPAQPVAQNMDVTLTPEVKQMIADEVKAELAAERASANANNASAPAEGADVNAAVPAALDPNVRLFIVASNLEVAADGQNCSLSPGDILVRTENTPDGMNSVAVNVISSQKADCRMGSMLRLQVADLQEMHNRFLEKLDSGMQTLADSQGKDGLPTGPAPERRVNANGTADALNAQVEIESQRAEADQAEKEVRQASVSANAPISAGNTDSPINK